MTSSLCLSHSLLPSHLHPHLFKLKTAETLTSFNEICTDPKPSSSISCSCISNPSTNSAAAVKNKRIRYRKAYPGEAKGIVEEMRFVAMKLRNEKTGSDGGGGAGSDGEAGDTWRPSMEGFVKYLVDSKLVFETLEKIVDESTDVACE